MDVESDRLMKHAKEIREGAGSRGGRNSSRSPSREGSRPPSRPQSRDGRPQSREGVLTFGAKGGTQAPRPTSAGSVSGEKRGARNKDKKNDIGSNMTAISNISKVNSRPGSASGTRPGSASGTRTRDGRQSAASSRGGDRSDSR